MNVCMSDARSNRGIETFGFEGQRPIFGLMPWLAFLRRALVFFLLRFFDGIPKD